MFDDLPKFLSLYLDVKLCLMSFFLQDLWTFECVKYSRVKRESRILSNVPDGTMRFLNVANNKLETILQCKLGLL